MTDGFINSFVDRPHFENYNNLEINNENLETIENYNAVYIILGVIFIICVIFLYWVTKVDKSKHEKRNKSVYNV